MKHLLILLFALPLFSIGQEKSCPEVKRKKQAIHYDYSKSWLTDSVGKKNITGEEEVHYYPSGAIKAKGNRRSGTWEEYFENGTVKIKQTYVNKKLTGETQCFSENATRLLPRFVPQEPIKNDTSIFNNTGLNIYRIFDSRDSTLDIINFGDYLSDSIRICDNSGLVIRIGLIKFAVKPGGLMVHVNADPLCNAIIIPVYRFSLPPENMKQSNSKEKNADLIIFKRENLKLLMGKIAVERRPALCKDTGHNPVKITRDDNGVYFKDIGNLVLFEYDIDKGGNKELFIINYFNCKQQVEIYKIDDD